VSRKISIAVACAVTAGIAYLCIFPVSGRWLDNLVAQEIEKATAGKVLTGKAKTYVFRQITIADLTVVDPGKWRAYFQQANMNYRFASLIKGELNARCILSNVRIDSSVLKMDPAGNELSGLMGLQRINPVHFDSVVMDVIASKNQFSTKNIVASGDTIRITGGGMADRVKGVDYRFSVFFSEDFLMNSGKILRAMLLQDDKGWYGFRVSVNGAYGNPSISVSTDVINLKMR
jgi:hypothetical protein